MDKISFPVRLDVERLLKQMRDIIKDKTMRELLNNTSADDLKSSLGCSFNPERSTDLNSDMEILEASLRNEKRDRKRQVVIQILESRIKKYRKFIERNPRSL